MRFLIAWDWGGKWRFCISYHSPCFWSTDLKLSHKNIEYSCFIDHKYIGHTCSEQSHSLRHVYINPKRRNIQKQEAANHFTFTDAFLKYLFLHSLDLWTCFRQGSGQTQDFACCLGLPKIVGKIISSR